MWGPSPFISKPSELRCKGTLLLVKRTVDGEIKRRHVVDLTSSTNLVCQKPVANFSLIRELMMQAGKVTLFSLDDGMSQFLQFPLDPNTRDLLSFDGPEGLAVDHVLPMGWTRAPYECTLGLTVIFISFGSDELWKYMDEMLRMTVGFDVSLESCKVHLALNLRFWKIAEEANLSLSREKAQHAVKEVKLVNLVFGNGVVRKPESLISGITSEGPSRPMVSAIEVVPWSARAIAKARFAWTCIKSTLR